MMRKHIVAVLCVRVQFPEQENMKIVSYIKNVPEKVEGMPSSFPPQFVIEFCVQRETFLLFVQADCDEGVDVNEYTVSNFWLWG